MNAENNNQEMLELLSAYLDDELTESQRDRVEQMLTDDVRARSLLANLRDASDAVSGLGVEEIPRDITDEVLYALERDTLLDGNEDLAVMAGERHLRMRQFMGAAGIMILVGAVVVVVYSIMKNPGLVDSDLGPLAKNEVVEQMVAEGVAGGAVSGAEENSNVVRFESFGEAARSLGKRRTEDGAVEKALEPVAADVEIMADIVMEQEVELPKLPPMKDFVMPEARLGEVRLASEVAGGDVVVIERLKNLVARYGGSYLSGSGSGAHSFAFVCKAVDFVDFYAELRDVLAGEIDLVLDGQGDYRQVMVKGISGDEVGMIAKLADGADQLKLAEMIVPGGRIEYVEQELEVVRPLWAQMAELVPEEFRVEFGDKLKEHFGTMETGVSLEEGELVASAAGDGAAAGVEADGSILERAVGVKKAMPMKGAMRSKRMAAEPAENGLVEEGVLSAEKAEEGEKASGGFVANEAVETMAAAVEPVVETEKVKVSEKVEADFIAVEILLSVVAGESGDVVPVQDGEIDGRIEFGF